MSRYADATGRGAGGAAGESDLVNPAAVEAARYICRRAPNLPKTTLVKLLYLTDREYSARHGKGLLGTKWWREDQGPLSSAATKMIAGPEFEHEETKTASGNPRVGHRDASKEPLRMLGSAELSVLDLVLAEYGRLGLVHLLKRVHDLPEVKTAPLKGEIALPRPRASDYLAELRDEIAREDAAGVYDNDFHLEDQEESRAREAEARVSARAGAY